MAVFFGQPFLFEAAIEMQFVLSLFITINAATAT